MCTLLPLSLALSPSPTLPRPRSPLPRSPASPMTTEPLDKLVSELHSLRVTLEGLRITLSTLLRISDDHEARVRTLESRTQYMTPVVAALTFLLGALATELVGRLV